MVILNFLSCLSFNNDLATFQSLMNSVLQLFLQKCVLVFFDDILIYNNSWTEHPQHLRVVPSVSVLRTNNFHVKKSKCDFAATSVTYLGHVISAFGVAMDADKVQVVSSWPQPSTTWALRGFLGLAEYYRRFIQDFDTSAALLTKATLNERSV